MPGEFFVDTSAWYPLLVAGHTDHAAFADAVRGLIARRLRPVTTNFVAAETHALILKRRGRRAALTGLHNLDRSAGIIVQSTHELEAVARRDWLERYTDRDFSLTDAVSFVVMRQRGIEDVLTLDHHFATAGFHVVPGSA